MTIWNWSIVLYVSLASATFVPTLIALVSGVKLNEGGASFRDSVFSEKAKISLEQHFSRLQGTLAFWKREATRNSRFHYYCLWWTIISSSIMPFLTQAVDPSDVASKWLLTIIAAHIALLLSFHRGLKVAERFKAFRHGESEFYDTYRRLLDSPDLFGHDEDTQLRKYFEDVEMIRKFVRNAETDSMPTLEEVRVEAAKSR